MRGLEKVATSGELPSPIIAEVLAPAALDVLVPAIRLIIPDESTFLIRD